MKKKTDIKWVYVAAGVLFVGLIYAWFYYKNTDFVVDNNTEWNISPEYMNDVKNAGQSGELNQ